MLRIFVMSLLLGLALAYAQAPDLHTGTAVALDASGHVLVAGWTTGSLGGENHGAADAFLAKYDADGQRLWLRQFGTPAEDNAYAVAASSSIFVVGSTDGDERTSQGFLARFDADGEQLWARQFEFASYLRTEAKGVAITADRNVVVTGTGWGTETDEDDYGAFLTMFDPDGNVLWEKPLNDEDYKYAHALTLDTSDNIYVVGGIRQVAKITSPTGTNAYVAKYDPQGELLWVREFGDVMMEWATAVSVNEFLESIYITGGTSTYGFGVREDFPSGPSTDAFLATFYRNGDSRGVRVFGSMRSYVGTGASADGANDIIVVGGGNGDLGGEPLGRSDAFVVKYDRFNDRLWARQFGTPEFDYAYGVAIDDTQHIYVTGYFGETHDDIRPYPLTRGGRQVFLAKYSSDGQQMWLKTFGE